MSYRRGDISTPVADQKQQQRLAHTPTPASARSTTGENDSAWELPDDSLSNGRRYNTERRCADGSFSSRTTRRKELQHVEQHSQSLSDDQVGVSIGEGHIFFPKKGQKLDVSFFRWHSSATSRTSYLRNVESHDSQLCEPDGEEYLPHCAVPEAAAPSANTSRQKRPDGHLCLSRVVGTTESGSPSCSTVRSQPPLRAPHPTQTSASGAVFVHGGRSTSRRPSSDLLLAAGRNATTNRSDSRFQARPTPHVPRQKRPQQGHDKAHLSPQHTSHNLRHPTTVLPDTSGSFEFGQLKGRGASAEVYTVFDRRRNRFAMKVVSAKSKRHWEGFQEEVALLEKFQNSKHIVRMYMSRSFRESLKLFLLLEYAESDFETYLKKFSPIGMPFHEIRNCWGQMVQAVGVIHHHHIVHSDVKPANFLMVRGQIKLSDFGLARSLDENQSHVSRAGQCGTIRYMAPETFFQPANAGDTNSPLKVKSSSDVWSLGIILYSLLYLQAPFEQLEKFRGSRIMFAISDPRVKILYPLLQRGNFEERCGMKKMKEAPLASSGSDDRAFRCMVAVLQRCLKYKSDDRWSCDEILFAWQKLKLVLGDGEVLQLPADDELFQCNPEPSGCEFVRFEEGDEIEQNCDENCGDFLLHVQQAEGLFPPTPGLGEVDAPPAPYPEDENHVTVTISEQFERAGTDVVLEDESEHLPLVAALKQVPVWDKKRPFSDGENWTQGPADPPDSTSRPKKWSTATIVLVVVLSGVVMALGIAGPIVYFKMRGGQGDNQEEKEDNPQKVASENTTTTSEGGILLGRGKAAPTSLDPAPAGGIMETSPARASPGSEVEIEQGAGARPLPTKISGRTRRPRPGKEINESASPAAGDFAAADDENLNLLDEDHYDHTTIGQKNTEHEPMDPAQGRGRRRKELTREHPAEKGRRLGINKQEAHLKNKPNKDKPVKWTAQRDPQGGKTDADKNGNANDIEPDREEPDDEQAEDEPELQNSNENDAQADTSDIKRGMKGKEDEQKTPPADVRATTKPEHKDVTEKPSTKPFPWSDDAEFREQPGPGNGKDHVGDTRRQRSAWTVVLDKLRSARVLADLTAISSSRGRPVPAEDYDEARKRRDEFLQDKLVQLQLVEKADDDIRKRLGSGGNNDARTEKERVRQFVQMVHRDIHENESTVSYPLVDSCFEALLDRNILWEPAGPEAYTNSLGRRDEIVAVRNWAHHVGEVIQSLKLVQKRAVENRSTRRLLAGGFSNADILRTVLYYANCPGRVLFARCAGDAERAALNAFDLRAKLKDVLLHAVKKTDSVSTFAKWRDLHAKHAR